jgi:hypothetical protein
VFVSCVCAVVHVRVRAVCRPATERWPVDHSKFEFKGEMGPWTVADQLAKLTHWNGGRNHLVLEIHDSERMRYDIGTPPHYL